MNNTTKSQLKALYFLSAFAVCLSIGRSIYTQHWSFIPYLEFVPYLDSLLDKSLQNKRKQTEFKNSCFYNGMAGFLT